MRKLLKSEGARTFLASLICIIIGLLVGYIVLLFINPSGAGKAISVVIKNFFYYPSAVAQMKYFGNTLVKSVPLLMCSLSILFAYKVGLFNIGASGQYTVGSCAALYLALKFQMPWWVCIIAAMIAGSLLGSISGTLKSYANVNEVLSCIMLNWISLYTVNMILSTVKESTSPYTLLISTESPGSLIPSAGLQKIFSGNNYVTIAMPFALLITVMIWIVLEKTTFGYELRATGHNRFAAKYAGMNEKRNIIVTMAIAGALSGLGGAFFYLTGFEQWLCTGSSVANMGFNGIAAAFLGGLSPIGSIFSSYFIQHITQGGAYVDKTMYSAQISDLISSIIIYLCGFVGLIKLNLHRISTKGEDEFEISQEKTEEDLQTVDVGAQGGAES